MAPIRYVTDEQNEVLEKLGIGERREDLENLSLNSSNEKIFQNYWLIENVKYNGKTSNYKLKKEVLPAKTQESHLEHAVEVGESDFHIPDMPLQFAIMKSIYSSEDSKQRSEIQSFFKKSYREYWLSSGTSVNYDSKRKDKVSHGVRRDSKEANIIGKDGFMSNLKDKVFSEVILEEENPIIANEVFNWATGQDLYIWRFNSKPKQPDKRVVGSGSGDGGSHVVAGGDPSDQGRCLGVCEE